MPSNQMSALPEKDEQRYKLPSVEFEYDVNGNIHIISTNSLFTKSDETDLQHHPSQTTTRTNEEKVPTTTVQPMTNNDNHLSVKPAMTNVKKTKVIAAVKVGMKMKQKQAGAYSSGTTLKSSQVINKNTNKIDGQPTSNNGEVFNKVSANSKGQRPPPVVPKPKAEKQSIKLKPEQSETILLDCDGEPLYAQVIKKEDRPAEKTANVLLTKSEETKSQSKADIFNEPIYSEPERSPPLDHKHYETSPEISLQREEFEEESPYYSVVPKDTKRTVFFGRKSMYTKISHDNDIDLTVTNEENVFEDEPIYSCVEETSINNTSKSSKAFSTSCVNENLEDPYTDVIELKSQNKVKTSFEPRVVTKQVEKRPTVNQGSQSVDVQILRKNIVNHHTTKGQIIENKTRDLAKNDHYTKFEKIADQHTRKLSTSMNSSSHIDITDSRPNSKSVSIDIQDNHGPLVTKSFVQDDRSPANPKVPAKVDEKWNNQDRSFSNHSVELRKAFADKTKRATKLDEINVDDSISISIGHQPTILPNKSEDGPRIVNVKVERISTTDPSYVPKHSLGNIKMNYQESSYPRTNHHYHNNNNTPSPNLQRNHKPKNNRMIKTDNDHQHRYKDDYDCDYRQATSYHYDDVSFPYRHVQHQNHHTPVKHQQLPHHSPYIQRPHQSHYNGNNNSYHSTENQRPVPKENRGANRKKHMRRVYSVQSSIEPEKNKKSTSFFSFLRGEKKSVRRNKSTSDAPLSDAYLSPDRVDYFEKNIGSV